MDKKIKFKYQGKIYQTANLENKLKCLSITMEDIEIIPEKDNKPEPLDIPLYRFKQISGSHTMYSVETEEEMKNRGVDLKDWQYDGIGYKPVK